MVCPAFEYKTPTLKHFVFKGSPISNSSNSLFKSGFLTYSVKRRISSGLSLLKSATNFLICNSMSLGIPFFQLIGFEGG